MSNPELVKVACIQLSASDDREANFAKARTLLEEAAAQGAMVAVLPELCFDHFFPQHSGESAFLDLAEEIPDGPTTARMQQWATELGMILLPNWLEKGRVGQYFDSTSVIATDGTFVGHTRMMHIAEGPGFHEKFYYTPGTTGPTCYAFELATLGVAICYDRHFPEYLRMLALQGADIICVNTAITADEPQDMFLDEMRAAAFTNQLFIALANRVGEDGGLVFGGRSVIIGPDGTVLEEGPVGDDAVVMATCDLSRIEAERRSRPWFRDRRPEWYGLLSEPTGELSDEDEDGEHDHDHEHEHDH